MSRAMFAVGIASLVICVAGCFSFEYHSATKSGKDPGELTKEELEEKVAEANKWKSVSLEDGQEGVFQGTAVTEDGGELRLVVRQTEKAINTKWTNAGGEGGGESTQSWSSTKKSDWNVKVP